MTEGWRRINLANCELRVPLHTGPDGYDLAAKFTPADGRERIPLTDTLQAMKVALAADQ